MDLPQAQIPHRTTDNSAGRVARRTEVAVPDANQGIRTLLRSVRNGTNGTISRNGTINSRRSIGSVRQMTFARKRPNIQNEYQAGNNNDFYRNEFEWKKFVFPRSSKTKIQKEPIYRHISRSLPIVVWKVLTFVQTQSRVRKSGSHNSIETSASELSSDSELRDQKWASSNDIYKAYSHSTPLTHRKVCIQPFL